jgi:anthranilate phosphoribosyltransferase
MISTSLPLTITNTQALQRVIEHRELFYEEMLVLMRRIMEGEMPPVMMGALIAGLRVKKETIGEIAAAAAVMREYVLPVEVSNHNHLIDLCGTGGDGAHTFNISTAAMFVAAAAGARVAKHGGRSVSSNTGSADVLEALGVNIHLSPDKVADCLDACGIGFMFAPNHHVSMKHAAPVRKELGVRTLFNILGPLTNPAKAPNQLMGVFHPDLVGIQVRVLQRLGSQHVMVVHGHDGLDELSLCGPTHVAELHHEEIREYDIHPADFGFDLCSLKDLKAASTQVSVDYIRRALSNEVGPVRDIVVLNAGAALYCANVSASLIDGVQLARDAIRNGKAAAKLQAFSHATQTLKTT